MHSGGLGHILGGFRCARRCAAAGRDRQTAIPAAGDPLVQARSLRLQQAGRSPFKDYALPEAAVALKQGAGRLIRHESDAGLLVIGDTRLVKMGYGKRLLAALPPMRRLQSEQEFYEALDRLTRTSTTDRSCP